MLLLEEKIEILNDTINFWKNYKFNLESSLGQWDDYSEEGLIKKGQCEEILIEIPFKITVLEQQMMVLTNQS